MKRMQDLAELQKIKSAGLVDLVDIFSYLDYNCGVKIS